MLGKEKLFADALALWSRVANAFLALDPETLAELSVLQGKVIKIDLKGTGLSFFMMFLGSGIRLQEQCSDEADITLTATPLSLVKLAMHKEQLMEEFKVSVDLSGDVSLAQKIRSIMERMDVDWEELFAKLFGDVLARKLGYFSSLGCAYLQDSKTLMKETVSEYLREESGMLVTSHEVDEFIRSVDQMRNAVDRLEARLTRLTEKR